MYNTAVMDNQFILRDLLVRLTYKCGYEFRVSEGIFSVKIETVDARRSDAHLIDTTSRDKAGYDCEDVKFFSSSDYLKQIPRYNRPFFILHNFFIPEYAWANFEEGEEWMLYRLIDVETHEVCEFFKYNGRPNFFPDHNRPYSIKRV